MRILVAYDGSLNSRVALKYGLEKTKEKGARLIALHVFDSRMFIDYWSAPGTDKKPILLAETEKAFV